MLLASILLFNGRSGNQTLQVKRAAQELVADIRLAQTHALSARQSDECPEFPHYDWKYGIDFTVDGTTPGHYILYTNCNASAQYQPSDEQVKVVDMEDVAISETTPVALYFFYEPPIPKMYIKGNPNTANFTITLRHLDNPSKCTRVQGNNRGNVWINESPCP